MPGGGGGLPPGSRVPEEGGGGGAGSNRFNSRLPVEIWNGLKLRKRNRKIVQLAFEKVSDFPDEDTFWRWLHGIAEVTEVPGKEIDYFEREAIERKYYLCMKDEDGAEWMEHIFGEEGIPYYDTNHEEVNIKARQMGDVWKDVTVRGVTPVTKIKDIEEHFKHFGEVKDIKYVVKGKFNVRSNKVILKLKMDEKNKLPVYIWNKLGDDYYERWEVTYQGSPKVCLQCYQRGHIKRDCGELGPTITQIKQGKVTWAQVLGGQQPQVKQPLQSSASAPVQEERKQAQLQAPASAPSLPQREEQGSTQWEEVKRRKGQDNMKRPADSPGEQQIKRSCEIETSNQFHVFSNDREGHEGEKRGEEEDQEREEAMVPVDKGDMEGQDRNEDKENATDISSLTNSAGTSENTDPDCVMEGGEESDKENKEDSVTNWQNSEKVPQVDGIVDMLPRKDQKAKDWSEEMEEEDSSENGKGIQKIGGEKLDASLMKKEAKKSSMEKEKERGKCETVGMGNLILILDKQKEKWLHYGKVSVTTGSRIEIRHKTEGLVWDKVIMRREEYRKEKIKITGGEKSAVCWMDTNGQDYGLIFKESEMTDKLFSYIKEVQNEGDMKKEDDMGFGLFD